ncbi:50S ribosomal protein L10 [Longirhabdus pacifica]|uniref:50S ribosomal protein L10 n=1 Tax=Longirhabdus pacifica TaxID=2305227 RepID=UPI001008A552|nr:50S ribosomal protein L10 [Longirhabdus pacifica]
MPNASVLEQKKEMVSSIATKLRESQSTVVVDYRGLDVAEVTELRKQLREANVELKVIKNNLVKRATQETDFTELDEFLVGPTAVAFSKEDALAAAKILSDFAKGHENLDIKVGIVEGKVVSQEDLKALASLPSRDGLLSMLLSVLQAPIRNMALAVKAVADKDGESTEG